MNLVNGSLYFRRLLLLIVIVGIIPVVSLGSYAYFTSASIAEQSAIEGNSQILLQSKLKIDQLLQTVDYLATQFITAPSTLEAVSQYDLMNELDEVTREFYKSLTRLQMIGTGIRDVALVSFSRDWVIDNSGLSSLNNEMNGKFLQLARTSKPSYWIGDEETDSIYFVKKIPVYAVEPTGLIVFRIPSVSFGELLVQAPFTGTTRILNHDMKVLASTDGSPFMQAKPEAEYLRQAMGSGSLSGSRTVRIDGKERVLTFEASPYSQWVYVSSVDKEQIMQGSRQIGRTTLFISLGMLVVTLVLTLTGSRFVYRPVRTLYEYVTRFVGKAEFATDADELQRIRVVFENMLDKQGQLDAKLLGYTSQLDELFTMKLLLGKMPNREVREKLELTGHGTNWKEKAVFAVRIDSLSETRYEEKDRDLLLFAINNIIEELVPEDRRIKPVCMEQHQATLIGSSGDKPGELDSYMDMILGKIQSSIKQVLQLKVSVGISRPFLDWAWASKAYSEALEALQYRIILEDESIVRIEDVEPSLHKSFEYPDMLENELVSDIKTGNLLMAEEHLASFTQEVVRQKLDHREYQMMMLRLLIRLLQVDDSLKGGLGATGTVYTEFLQLSNVSEMEGWLMMRFIDPLIRQVKTAAVEQHRTISRQIMDLVHADYDKPLTLEGCAAQLNYTPSYISKVFRKETGINFLDYVQTYRLNVAKRWLIETDMRISQIAERLQYNNSQNFIRYFRKMEGMTPGQYREGQR
ncbi:MAG: transcriptional regulator, AraC family [Paenibacillaceae bacterium]|jgi:AraC-like DNA-binding protein|nr:transcriptional regulator, AraC family [Paenibacillaceae bacterium]